MTLWWLQLSVRCFRDRQKYSATTMSKICSSTRARPATRTAIGWSSCCPSRRACGRTRSPASPGTLC